MKGDVISRQSAIDAVYEAFCYAYCDNCEKDMNEDLCGDCHRKYQNWAASKKAVESAINSVPSAQPEIIRCKDCCYYDPSEIDGESDWCHWWGETTEGNAFCSYAKRKGDQT